MKLPDLIIISSSTYGLIDSEAKIVIGDHTFDLSEEDPEVSLVSFGPSLGTFEFDSVWVQDV